MDYYPADHGRCGFTWLITRRSGACRRPHLVRAFDCESKRGGIVKRILLAAAIVAIAASAVSAVPPTKLFETNRVLATCAHGA
jgi:hypothetical protein